ncbi:hypothetical protein [Enterococcus hirae]|uniref:hypothetical protein n=1 Tax=Enterococcus hirae TaxID=1354 RepID=UPI001378E236|nr:hypothetical protein [Enterococcus hirae]NBA55536.1 hypothetical protein [Enterococcus hirae]
MKWLINRKLNNRNAEKAIINEKQVKSERFSLIGLERSITLKMLVKQLCKCLVFARTSTGKLEIPNNWDSLEKLNNND